jgi:hypothetical protein
LAIGRWEEENDGRVRLVSERARDGERERASGPTWPRCWTERVGRGKRRSARGWAASERALLGRAEGEEEKRPVLPIFDFLFPKI